MISIILLEPEHDGNIGAVARVMRNFGFNDLVLVEPKVDHLSEVAICRSKHAKKVLENAKVISRQALFKEFDTVIGTTAKTGTDYNIPRSPLTPEQLAKKYKSKIHSRHNVGILFGREGKGLFNSEVRMCDFILSIPASITYPTLNLSHSVGVVCYELFKNQPQKESKIEYAKKEEKDILHKEIANVIKKTKFATPDKKETQKRVWKRIIGKAFLTKREAFALIGFFKKLK